MKKLLTILTISMSISLATNLYGQSAGDFRSLTNGNWSSAVTWETFNGTVWAAAVAAPVGTEKIIIDDSVAVDVAIDISDTVSVEGSGILSVVGGTLTIKNGGVYQHNRNGGTLPSPVWETGSTCLITGVTGTSPANNNQNFYNFAWNCPGQSSNLNLVWSGNTIGGNLTCISSGSSQFRLSNNTTHLDPVTINGNIVVTGGILTSTGSSGTAVYNFNVNGNINVTGGNFSLSRGSGGTANWYLFGDLSVANATLQTSNNASKFIFTALDTQFVSLSSVSYTGTFNYDVDTNATIWVIDNADTVDMTVRGTLINFGSILKDSAAAISFENNSVYRHARDGGSIPTATWMTGSTVEITGANVSNPGNGNQNFYKVVWNCPGQTGNRSMNWNNITIGGDINIISTGSGRWQLCAPPTNETATVNINGDIIQSAGNFTSNGTSNGNTTITINVYGNINITGGNFSASRGSQGTTGVTNWNFYGENFSLSDATTQNSNSQGASFLFAGTGVQNLTLSNVNFAGGFPVEVNPGATVYLGSSQVRGSGWFYVRAGATLATAHPHGLDSALVTTGTRHLNASGNYIFNGTAEQVTGSLLPAAINKLIISNAAGVTLSADVTVNDTLSLLSGDLNLGAATLTVGSTGYLSETLNNTVKGTGKIVATGNIGTPSSVNVGGLGVVLTADKNLGSTTIERYHSAPSGDGNQGILRYYNISPGQNNSGLNATLRFYYDESELNGINEATLVLFKSASGLDNTWSPRGGSVNTTDNYIELSGITDFSYWAAASSTTPLPVELVSFTVSIDKKRVILNWSTASEKQNQGWEIERKSEKLSWNKIGFVPGAGDRAELASYSYIDEEVPSGKVQYRIKQIDYDGTFKYSNVIEVDVANTPQSFALHQNYPNPFNPETNIKFEVPEASFINISIYNALGEKVADLINEFMDEGRYTKSFNASELNSGIYFYQLTSNTKTLTKKMIVIK